METSDQGITFSNWLANELNMRNLTHAELAAQAGLGRSTISMIVTGGREPGPDAVLGIAKAFKLPILYVYKLAGLLPDDYTDLDQLTQQQLEIVRLFDDLDPQAQQEILEVVRVMARNRK